MLSFNNVDALLCLTLVAFVLLLRSKRNLFNLFDPVSYFSVIHIVLFFIAAFYRRIYEVVVPISDNTLILLCCCMMLFAVGATLPDIIFENIKKVIFPNNHTVNSNISLSYKSPPKYYVNTAWILFFAGTLGVLIFIIKCGGILWFKSDFDDYRISARAGVGWLVLPSIVFITYTSISLFSYYLILKNKKFLSIIIAIIGGLLLLQFGNRAPAFEIIVACGFIYCWYKWEKVPILLIASGCFLLLFLLGVMQVIRQGITKDFIMILFQSIWRPFVNIQNFDLIVNSFPSRLKYLYGKSYLMDFAVIAPGYQVNFGTWLKDQLGLDFTGGSVTVTYLGEFYANFGIYGALIGAFLTGLILNIVAKYCKKYYYDYSNYQTVLCITITCKSIVSSGIVTPFLYIMLPYAIYRLIFSQTLWAHNILFGNIKQIDN